MGMLPPHDGGDEGECPLKGAVGEKCCKPCRKTMTKEGPAESCKTCAFTAAMKECKDKYSQCKNVSKESCKDCKGERCKVCHACKECVMGQLPRDDRPDDEKEEEEHKEYEEGKKEEEGGKEEDPKKECHQKCDDMMKKVGGEEELRKQGKHDEADKVAKEHKERVEGCREGCDKL